MPADLFANNASTTLAAGITSGATSLTVASSAGFPVPTSGASLLRVLIGTEILTVTAVSGTTWTVTRGEESTTAADHSSGDAVTMVVTAGSLNNLGAGGGDYFRSGYFSYGIFGNPNATLALTTGLMYARPFLVPAARTFNQIGINVITGATAGGVLRFGIYTGAGVPTSLLLDAGTVASTSVGSAAVTISQTLDPGVYWVTCVAQIAGCSVSGMGALVSPYISTTTTNNGAGGAGYTTSSVTGSLPASPTWAPSNSNPAIGLRAA